MVTQSSVNHTYSDLVKQSAISPIYIYSFLIGRVVEWLRRGAKEEQVQVDSNLQHVTDSNDIYSSFKAIQSEILKKNKIKIEEFFNKFIITINKINVKDNAKGLTRDQREHIYKNITYVRERSFDSENAELIPLMKEKEKIGKQLSSMERVSKESLSKISSTNQAVAIDKEILHVKACYLKMRAALDEYYKKFDFTSDEVNSPAFQSLTLESHFPKRKYFMMLAGDLLQGAVNVFERIQASQKKLFYKEWQLACAAQGLTLPEEIQELSWKEMKQKILERNGKGCSEIINKFDKIKDALDQFATVIKERRLFILQDKRLGNNNPNEQLAKDEANWKKQMKEADEAIVEMAENLKAAYTTIGIVTGEFSNNMNRNTQLKAAGAVLTQARDDILNSKERWSTPIDRTVQLPGSYSSKAGEFKPSTLRHVMVCPNAGYASSAFRGRKDVQVPIQPNWWNVELQIQAEEGLRTVGFSRSAIQVEFMSEDQTKADHGDKDRMQATQRQVLEVLSEKAVRRFKQSPSKGGAGLSKDKPLVLDITEVSLMTPDTVRSLLLKDPKLGRVAKEVSGWTTDISGWERRMMQENQDAWLFFDASNTTAWEEGRPSSFSYTYSNGDKREVVVHLEKKPEPKVVYEIVYTSVKGEKTNLFVQFDIAFYNAGCSERSKMMTHFTSKEKIAKKLQLLCNVLADKINALPNRNESDTFCHTVEAIKSLSSVAFEAGREKAFKATSDHFLSRGFNKLKEAFLNGKELFLQVLINEKLERLKQKLKGGVKVDNSLLEAAKVSIIQLSSKELASIAQAIPQEVLLEDNIGLERVCEVGFPFVRTLIAHETGRQIIEVFAAHFGKKLTADELLGMKLPEEFTSQQDKLAGNTNALEDKVNRKAFAKHQKRVTKKLVELDARRASLRKEIEANQSTHLIIQRIDNQVKLIKDLRHKLLQSEVVYSADKSEKNEQQRKLAFTNWKTARDQLHSLIQNELSLKSSTGMKTCLELIRYEDNLVALHDEVNDLLTFQTFRDLQFMRNNMYCLPSKIMALSIYLNEDPHTGCRSGKDRTAVQDMEISTIFALEALKGRISNYREMEEDLLTLDVREAIFLNSGQIDDLAFRNIGSYGLNLSGSYGSYLSGFRQLGKNWEQPITGGVWETFKKCY